MEGQRGEDEGEGVCIVFYICSICFFLKIGFE